MDSTDDVREPVLLSITVLESSPFIRGGELPSVHTRKSLSPWKTDGRNVYKMVLRVGLSEVKHTIHGMTFYTLVSFTSFLSLTD